MDDSKQIRRMHFHDGMSQPAIAEQLGRSWKMVAKAIQEAVPPAYRQSQAKGRSILGSVIPTIVPCQARIEEVSHESELERIYETERHLLYVWPAREHVIIYCLQDSNRVRSF